MKQVDKISLAELKEMGEKMWGSLVKADVDIERGVMVVDMEMHADGEAFLLESGSKQRDIWGINLHPAKFGSKEFVEFDSVINLRPSQNNRSRGVHDGTIQQKIIEIVDWIVHE